MFSINAYGEPTKGPSFLHGWNFLIFVRGNEDAPMLRELALDAGPAIVFNSHLIAAEQLDDPDAAVLWLAPVLHNLCRHLLEDGLHPFSFWRFNSWRWCRFRNMLCRHASMNWEQVIAAAEREGVEWMADTLVQGALFESGFLDRLEGRSFELFGGHGPRAGGSAYDPLH
ncbi:MAG: hypothetical protein ACXIVF_11990 [Rhizobiaceae bacterium]